MKALIRKHQYNLKISARALLIFGIWGFLRVFVFKTSGKTLYTDIVEQLQVITGVNAAFIEFAIILCYIIFEIAFRIYVWRSAMAESKGRKRSSAYLYISTIYIISSVVAYGFYLFSAKLNNTLGMDISLVIIDASTLIALIIIIVSAIKLRKFNNIQKGTGEDNAD